MGRNATLDRVRMVLALMVVGIHVDLFADVSTAAEELFVNHVFRIAVPFFLIATGYFLADKLDDPALFWSWFRRLGVLYLFWSAFYLPIMVAGHAAGHPLLGVLHNLVTGFQHLWYLLAALEAALILFLARAVVARGWFAAACGLLYLAGVGIEYGSAYGVLGAAGRIAAPHGEVYRNALFVGLPMLWLGVTMRRAGPRLAEAGRAWRAAAVLGGALLLAEFAVNLRFLPGYHLDLLVSLPVVCMALFGLCLDAPATSESRTLPFVASAIYFLHPAVIFALERTGRLAQAGSIAVYLAVVALTIVCAAIAIAVNRGVVRRTRFSLL